MLCDIGPLLRIFGIYHEPLLKAGLGIGLDGLGLDVGNDTGGRGTGCQAAAKVDEIGVLIRIRQLVQRANTRPAWSADFSPLIGINSLRPTEIEENDDRRIAHGCEMPGES